MKKLLVVVAMFAAALAAKNVPRNHVGELLSMVSVPCGPMETSSLGNALLGAPQVQIQEERLCAEYILHSEGLYYRIRSKDRKHPVLLPIGEQAQFHLEKGHMLLQVEDFDQEVYQFSVLAIIPEAHAAGFLRSSAAGKKPPE
ncbi:MAG: hypothetical protein WCC22_15540 [Terriglobales bacterium]